MDFDFDTITRGLDLAGTGLKHSDTALTLGKKLKELIGKNGSKDQGQQRDIIIDLISELQDAKETNLNLRQQLQDLQSAVFEAQKSHDEFARYYLVETNGGDKIFRLKTELANGEPDHFICPLCKEEGIKTILQGDGDYADCPIHARSFRLNKRNPNRRPGIVVV